MPNFLDIKDLNKSQLNQIIENANNLKLNKFSKQKLSLNLSHEEILNRNYYRGRFGSILRNNRMIYNWDEVALK